MRRITLLIGLTLFLPTSVLARSASQHHRNHYTICTLRKDHSEPKRCWRVPMPRHWKVPTGHHKNCSWDGSQWVCITWPTFKPKPQVVRTYSYQQTWLVTYYTDSGLMADGASTHWGAAACGDEIPSETRISVPGVGLLTCEDHEACNPPFTCFHHVDVWGYHQGLGSDYRTITIYAN